jgi:preprotein translocase subunit YajC
MNPLDLLIPVAHAQAAPAASQGGGLLTLWPFVVLMIVFYLMLIRPQTKRQKEQRDMLAKLQKGDEVLTSSGIAGKVDEIGESFITLEIADGVRVKFQRGAINIVLPRGSLKAS